MKIKVISLIIIIIMIIACQSEHAKLKEAADRKKIDSITEVMLKIEDHLQDSIRAIVHEDNKNK